VSDGKDRLVEALSREQSDATPILVMTTARPSVRCVGRYGEDLCAVCMYWQYAWDHKATVTNEKSEATTFVL
jgi:hypothetical protein